ncbi:polysaccharide lyase 6 family protein [Paenibacillus hamazuiensis]|uniref:polysaccharide lyase 6 family protein n=1 Tax=Paenibacillus hamazuiensis TaxID=2936508 RepID=UPI00200BE4CE|nr:polysaccharide lyase 6 family protein [Paenibacillus hamazuiensis]
MKKNMFKVLQMVCIGVLALPAAGLAAGSGNAEQGNFVSASNSTYAPVSAADTADAVSVSNASELAAAIAAATAGTTILLEDGEYAQNSTFSISGKNGTSDSPITIAARHAGKAVISGKAGFNISNSSYVVIQGMKFTGTVTAVNLNNSNHIRVTRNTFALANINNPSGFKWLQFSGSNSHHNRIDRNEFGPRGDLGQMIAFQGTVMSQYDVIEYNYFHDAAPQTENGGETIRVGLSGSSMSSGFTTIQYNLFVNCDSDAEIISVKSGNNTIRYNTFIDNKGQVTARHGHANSYYGNYFFRTGDKPGVGGLRIYANDQKIYNNYFENIPGTIHIDGGDYDAGPDGKNYDSSVLTKHWRVYRAQVFNNTIVGSSSGIVIGKSYTYAPVDSIVANNIVIGSGGPLYNEMKETNTAFYGNIGFGGGTLSNVSRTADEIREIDPLLVQADGVSRLTAGSPAIDASMWSSPLLVEDMDGQPRQAADTGADEYSGDPVRRRPLTVSDVGPGSVIVVQSKVQGTEHSGWYRSDVSVALSPLNTEPGVGRVEYRTDAEAAWQEYAGSPIRLTEEGTHTLSYRYLNEDGMAESENAQTFRIDKSAPLATLLANGQQLADGAVFADTVTLALQLRASDNLSGIANTSFTVAGATYASQAALPLAGLLGESRIDFKAEDTAGNVKTGAITFKVTPTWDTLSALLDGYVTTGAVRGPLVPQLMGSLDQARHQNDKGSVKQAAKFLDNFVKHLTRDEMADSITPAARQALQNYAEALKNLWENA